MQGCNQRKISLTVLLFAVPVLGLAAPPSMDDGGEIVIEHVEHLSDIQRAVIDNEIEQAKQTMQPNGFTAPYGAAPAQPEFIWPIRKAIGVTDFNVDAISNFVDQDGISPDSLLDYNCGMRTYDLPGYNHKGIDIFSWPFSWQKKNNSDVEIISAAAGTIINKSDGNSDTSCSFSGSNWNAVYIMHSDGSVAWYGHLKKDSLTAKQVGDTVAAGEYLGVMGSSGNSTGPHLHLEVYDAQGNLIDPYQGSCNALNTDSWWKNQPSYYESQVNALGVGTASIQWNACPQEAVTNFTNTYQTGDPIRFSTFYRDQRSSLASVYSITKPDGAELVDWTHAPSVAHYSASWWSWAYTSFNQTMSGIWSFNVDFNGKDYSSEFYLVDSCAIVDTVPSQILNDAIAYGARSTLTTDNNVIDINAGARMTLLAASKVTIGNGMSVANTGTLTVKNTDVCSESIANEG